MTFLEVYKKVSVLRNNSRDTFFSNIYGKMFPDEMEVECHETEASIVIWFTERFRVRCLFATSNLIDLNKAMSCLEKGSICEFLFKQGDREDLYNLIFSSLGFSQYSFYTRITETWGDVSPKTIPEVGRRKILEELYDPAFGVYPTLDDTEELYKITRETFDINCDDTFTISEWREIINEKRCLIYKENGEIVCLYVWRLDGRALYSNMSINRGPANYMYNLERRIFDEYFEKGIRTFYWWVERKNKAQKRRANTNSQIPKLLKSSSYLYNAIYIKG